MILRFGQIAHSLPQGHNMLFLLHISVELVAVSCREVEVDRRDAQTPA
jgi:hypothetical protein